MCVLTLFFLKQKHLNSMKSWLREEEIIMIALQTVAHASSSAAHRGEDQEDKMRLFFYLRKTEKGAGFDSYYKR